MSELFDWILVDIEDGSVTGTNDSKVAAQFALSENNIVINTSECAVYTGYDVVQDENGDYVPNIEQIREQKLYKFD